MAHTKSTLIPVPIPLRFLLASRPAIMGKVLGIVYRTLATHLIHQAGHREGSRVFTACRRGSQCQ
ncbi:MAG TPA: hypothetical protein ENI62_15435 [Gammaproteobacteria bacterium]|nr:hypothetical protein [Gammaproteobacteria bacterium]